MTPIKVLLIHRESDVYRHLTGWWSYPVPEFEWTILKVKPEWFIADMDYAPDHDLIVLDDWIFGQIKHAKKPLAYVVVDSARSKAQLERNRQQAQDANLILVDSDNLESFSGIGKPVRRFAYAVNEQLFYPREKIYDVAFLCWPTDERRKVQGWCNDICRRRGWTLATGTYDWPNYARFLCSAKVVVHKAHVVNARSWRVFDVMASRGCLLSSPLPTISGDGIVSGEHYCEYMNAEQLEHELISLLDDNHWSEIAEAGYQHVMAHHTWSIRATELRETLREVFQW